ncbi:MAG: hypothetical protein ABW186_10360 [Rhodanobacteraceae bacterium]
MPPSPSTASCADVLFAGFFDDPEVPGCGNIVVQEVLLTGDNLYGIYINWLTGQTAVGAPPQFPANFNVYSASGQIEFFWPDGGNNKCVAGADGEECLVLDSGDIVGPSWNFGNGHATDFRRAGITFVGFEFHPYPTAPETRYFGYVELFSFNDSGVPFSIIGYGYEYTGRPIMVFPL